ncbi:serine-rich adhesin for platelets-like [Mytilus edulis]|uniref:serine-rich adhesin for platelets-like n=1 Tax=Mytilus edulis TaxID=6550 RepID=UPI0039EE9B7B
MEQPPLSPVPINLSVTKDSQKNQLLQDEVNISYSEGCVGGGQSSFSSRVLFPAVLGSQEERENENSSRSFCSQSVSSGPIFQIGDQQEKHLLKGVLLDPPDPSVTLFTDASLMGLGAYLEGRTASGLWSGQSTHQFARYESCVSFSPSVSGCDSGSVTTGCHGQLHSSGLSSESRRDPFLFSVSSEQGNSSSVSQSRYNSVSETCSRQSKSSGGCSLPFPCSSEHRMGNSSISVSGDHSLLGSSSYRSFCHQSESQVGDLCFSHSRRESLGSRCYDPILEGNVQLHVPSFSSSFKDLAQDSEGSFQDHSYCSGLAKTVLVLRTTTSVLCEASPSSYKRGSTVSIQRKKTSSGSRESPSARLVAVRNSLRKGGFSEGATKRISGSVRKSTGAVYDSKWSIFCTWCLSKQIDPSTVTVQQLRDFFLHLFEEKGYSPSSIKGYRSAIARTISLSGGSDFGDNEFLSLLIKTFALIDLVKGIALATGRRRSEIHALSISESCLRFAADKFSVTLLTDPSFLAKNQLPDKGSGLIVIPALPPTADNQVLCPVRALLVYLASSANLRSAGSSRLFIPIKKGISYISAKTISTWICNTVILAYKSASSEVLVKHQVKTHEVRALASSWNIFNSSSMSEIMSAGFWRSDSAFYNHYLRAMPLHCDNLYFLGPLVAAQQKNTIAAMWKKNIPFATECCISSFDVGSYSDAVRSLRSAVVINGQVPADSSCTTVPPQDKLNDGYDEDVSPIFSQEIKLQTNSILKLHKTSYSNRLAHSVSLNKETTPGNTKKERKKTRKAAYKAARTEGNKTSSDSSEQQASKSAEANTNSSSTQPDISKFLTPNNKTKAAKERTPPTPNQPDGKRQSVHL